MVSFRRPETIFNIDEVHCCNISAHHSAWNIVGTQQVFVKKRKGGRNTGKEKRKGLLKNRLNVQTCL